MQVIDVKVGDLRPYKNNPRLNDEAVDYVERSIREFGFKVPLVIDKDRVIVTGHTRLKAAKRLGLDSVPCVMADDLSPEQVKAFRVADNAVSEVALWDMEKLEVELADIELDMEVFGLDFGGFDSDMGISGDDEGMEEDEGEDEGYYGDERERTNRAYNLDLLPFTNLTSDFWEMPIISKTDFIPTDLIGFNYAMSSENKETGIHCYVDDYQFERLWNDPEKYTEVLSAYECFLSPDFSLYMDMPMPMKIWNIYRSRHIGAFYQSQGLTVIPTVSWAEPETFEFCFRGIERGSVVSVSTVGVKGDNYALKVWREGMDAMIETVRPAAILVYGGELEYDYKGVAVHYYHNKVTEAWKGANNES